MFVSPAYAQAAGATANGGIGAILSTFGLPLMIIPLFWLLILRPQQQRQKLHQAAILAVKKGDSVVTAGGLMGKVTKVEDAVVEVEISNGVKVRVVKATIAEVTPLGSKPAND
ncbi:preprotein translocase subunit YajC [Sphingomonas sp. AR_OL41]|jgi:preprotein translocase subunit YajC|uniref:preprotein translocase subunit YajC n=1 Tax=Sphingomonas sp. AR_OL41 TaxID=3042729 RepID=UPI00248135B7|nr:preprotein translocase subunit YajC [Sphingomonas sp. AR_OL41]MDH7973336.1 preprotein translocase subunit YajC [Sphingomonas sp. AR_OL41]